MIPIFWISGRKKKGVFSLTGKGEAYAGLQLGSSMSAVVSIVPEKRKAVSADVKMVARMLGAACDM